MPSSTKIDVVVKSEGQIIGHRPNSPVRKLPDGTAGIVVHGFVYAVSENHSVDLASDGIPKKDCPVFFSSNEELLYAEPSGADGWWFIEKAQGRSYLAFDGDEEFATQLNEAFEAEGLSSGYRESFRPAKNGYFYDYFIRLPTYVNESHVRQIIQSVDYEKSKLDHSEDSELDIRPLIDHLGGPQQFLENLTDILIARAKLEDEREELLERNQNLEQGLAEISAQLEQVKEVGRQLTLQMKLLKGERDRLHRELNAVTTPANEGSLPWDDVKAKEIDRLSMELETISEHRDLAVNEAQHMQTALADAESRVERLEAMLENLTSENRPTQFLPFDRLSSSKNEKRILHQILSGAFPRLELQDSDKKTLLQEFKSISDCAKVMVDLQEGRTPQHTKKWQGKKGVFEVDKIRTGIKGRETMGRIYFKKNSENDSISVIVQVKSGDGKQQSEFVKKRF